MGWIWLLKEFFFSFYSQYDQTVCKWLNDGLSSGWRLKFGQNELKLNTHIILLLLVSKAFSCFASLCGCLLWPTQAFDSISNLTIAQDMKWNCGECIKTFKLNLYLQIIWYSTNNEFITVKFELIFHQTTLFIFCTKHLVCTFLV